MNGRRRSIGHSRRLAPEVDESENYLFAIESFAPTYTFSAGSNFQNAVHDEHIDANILARCLAPGKFAGRLTTFNLLGDRNLARQQSEESASFKAAIVGTLTFRGKQSEYLGGIPFDALMHLQTLLAASKFEFICLAGASMYRGTATISRINFCSMLDEVDWPAFQKT